MTLDRRGQGDIPKYIRGRKEGMHREEVIKNTWNESMGPKKKKKYNVQQRFSLEDEHEEEDEELIDLFDSINLPDSFSTDSPMFKQETNKEPEAKRQPNSGAMWYAKGDISLEHALMEVKERGTVNSRGEKTISIPKKWLDKQEEEAYLEGKHFWYIAFAYKGSDSVYITKPYEHEIELIQELRRLQKENEILREVNKGFDKEKRDN